MNKTLILFLSLLLCLSLLSCTLENDPKFSELVSSFSESKDMVSISNVESDPSESYSAGDAEQSFYKSKIEMQQQYPEIDLLCNGAPEISDNDKKIVIYKKDDPSEKITITDRSVLRMFYDLFKVNRVYTTEFVLSRYSQYIYEIYYHDAIISITVHDDHIFSLAQYPGKYFLTDSTITQLGRAFLEADDFAPVLSTIARMYYSALLIDETDGTPFFSEYNISTLVRSFLEMNAEQVSKPVSEPDVEQKLTFYYYGEKIYMTIYDGYISIGDGDSQTWFVATSEDVSQMVSVLSVP